MASTLKLVHAPPGLEPSVTTKEAPTQPGYVVLISGLPITMLSDVMMEAMLEQAGLDVSALSFDLRTGRPRGQAIVTFSSRRLAEQCSRHFHGCPWGPAGAPVTAQIVSKGTVRSKLPSTRHSQRGASSGHALPKPVGVAGMPGLSVDELLLIQMEAREDAELGHDAVNEETFGADAALGWSYEQQVAANAKLMDMPMFVSAKLAASSDVSTDVSESDTDDQGSIEGAPQAAV